VSNIRPQLGFQYNFLSTKADIAIGGSGAGVGKTYSLLLEALRYSHLKNFRGSFFRRTLADFKKPNAIRDETMKIYPLIGGAPCDNGMLWRFKNNSQISLLGFQYESDFINYQGPQFDFIGIDEITTFTEFITFFLISRLRSVTGINPYLRATCNPDPDSFVKRMILWYLDDNGEYPILERSGIIRYFIKTKDEYVWGWNKKEVYNKIPEFFEEFERNGVNPLDLIKSFTFIPGSIYDNKKLLSSNPGYLGNLASLSDEEKARYLYGNWKVKLNDSMLCDYEAIESIFSNYVTNGNRYITCDASGYGRDFTVIYVWNGWQVIHIEVITKSGSMDIYDAIERLRQQYNVMKHRCNVDADGIGNSTVIRGGYKAFHGGAGSKWNVKSKLKEAYTNFKTQCYYILCREYINTGLLSILITNDNVVIDGVKTTKMKVLGVIKDIRDLIKEDLRAIRIVSKLTEGKHAINSKDEQKVILGRSPDFSDTLMQKVAFDFDKIIY